MYVAIYICIPDYCSSMSISIYSSAHCHERHPDLDSLTPNLSYNLSSIFLCVVQYRSSGINKAAKKLDSKSPIYYSLPLKTKNILTISEYFPLKPYIFVA